ncbi:helix-turn-helix domain-containing protein [Streptococcus uberis]|uniref:helix-turn-helix domain-containing protein n=1 Tax=Streptococcus uberis TaxID=1349 RepID=UPI00193984F9|nr:helix-turn-helix transcriptional regulator [Streptococcus uberis]
MIRNNLAKLMIDRGISATQLFNDTGIARSTISKISNNNTDKISLKTIDTICNYLGVSPADFFDFLEYEIKINCGFEKYESLNEVLDQYRDRDDIKEEAWLSISFYRNNSIKFNFDFNFDFIREYELGVPDEFALSTYLNDMKYNEANPSSDLFDEIPIQFKKEILDEAKQKLSTYFDVYEETPTIKYFDPVSIEIL